MRGTIKFGPKTRSLKYHELEDKVRVTGWWCESCDEGILEGEELRLLLKREKTLSPERVIRMMAHVAILRLTSPALVCSVRS